MREVRNKLGLSQKVAKPKGLGVSQVQGKNLGVSQKPTPKRALNTFAHNIEKPEKSKAESSD